MLQRNADAIAKSANDAITSLAVARTHTGQPVRAGELLVPVPEVGIERIGLVGSERPDRRRHGASLRARAAAPSGRRRYSVPHLYETGSP